MASSVAVSFLSLLAPASGAVADPAALASPFAAAQVVPSGHRKPQPPVVVLTRISPVTVRSGTVLRVAGRVRTAQPLTQVIARLEMRPTPFVSRSEITEAAAAPPFTTPILGATDTIGKVKAHSSRSFSIAIPADVLPVSATDEGVYPLRIVVTAGTNARTLGSFSTFLPWLPDPGAVSPSRLLFFWPLVDQPRRDAAGAFVSPGLGEELRRGQRLGTLESAGRAADVTWLVDPSLLNDVAELGGSRARRWLTELRAAVADTDVVALPFGDPDLAAVAAANGVDLLRSATARAQRVAQLALGDSVRTDLGWPADGAADDDTIATAHRTGAQFLLLDEQTAPLVEPLNYTPSGRLQLPDPDVELLLADRPASALVASPAKGRTDVLISRQRFLAETLLHTLELPSQPRLLVIAPPRRWDPAPAWARALTEAAAKARWLKPVTLDEAVQPSPPSALREPPSIPDASALRQLDGELVVRATSGLRDARRLGAILTDPNALARPIEESLFSSISTAWRANPDAALTSQTATVDRLAAQRGRVRIVSRDATFSDDRGQLPISIRNLLDQPIVVRLSVISEDPLRLRVDAPDQRIRIPPQGLESVIVNLDAVTSGRLNVEAQLRTPGGKHFSDPVSLGVDVRAYGRVALIVFGAAAILMLAAVVVRITRRIRNSRRSPA